jgi:hypothetical protein
VILHHRQGLVDRQRAMKAAMMVSLRINQKQRQKALDRLEWAHRADVLSKSKFLVILVDFT